MPFCGRGFMVTPAVQLPLTRRATILLHALILLSVLGFCLALGTVTPLVAILAASFVGWTMVDYPIKGKPLVMPAWLLNSIVLGGACYLAWEIVRDYGGGNQNIILALAHFVMVLLACKLQEP